MRPFFPAREPGRPVFVAHRGASDRALENSPAAFSLAVTENADMIEFDVRLSSDGVPWFSTTTARGGRRRRTWPSRARRRRASGRSG